MHGSTTKHGLKSIHINIRSLYNKISKVKCIARKEKPHIIGISEAELFKPHHLEKSLKIPEYDLLLPKSWNELRNASCCLCEKGDSLSAS